MIKYNLLVLEMFPQFWVEMEVFLDSLILTKEDRSLVLDSYYLVLNLNMNVIDHYV